MNIIQFPDNFVKLILELNSNFTRPSFEHFKIVLSGILIGGPKKTLTAGIRLNNLKCHFSNIHRFVGKYKWDITNLVFDLLGILDKFLHITQEYVFALDDTLVPKYGSKIFGRGCHFDHARKPNRSKYILGHNWVVLGLLYHCSIFSKWLCFPLLSQLFIPESVLPKGTSYRSRIKIAVEMITRIKVFVNKKVILIADGLYAKALLVSICIAQDISLISRLRSDTCLYEIPNADSLKRRGRPRKYG